MENGHCTEQMTAVPSNQRRSMDLRWDHNSLRGQQPVDTCRIAPHVTCHKFTVKRSALYKSYPIATIPRDERRSHRCWRWGWDWSGSDGHRCGRGCGNRHRRWGWSWSWGGRGRGGSIVETGKARRRCGVVGFRAGGEWVVRVAVAATPTVTRRHDRAAGHAIGRRAEIVLHGKRMPEFMRHRAE
jgi:hypothetical protein